MTTKGTVLAVSGDRADVEVRRRAMCDGCPNDSSDPNACGHVCAMSSLLGDRKSMTVHVKNNAGAKVGDTVELETPDRTVLASAFLVFILPLILAAVCYIAAERFFTYTYTPWIAAVIGFALSLGIVAAAESKAKNDPNRLRMTKILRTKTEE